MELLVATRSAGKSREIQRILAAVPGLIVKNLDEAGITFEAAEDDLEPYATFEENALSKARYFFDRSGMATVADDSGIEVDALAGAPGVRSKRFAPDQGLEGQSLDDANNRHLVGRLAGVATEARAARYVCVAALLSGKDEPLLIRGEAPGVIIDEARGTGGFGYDPFMLDPEVGKTFAEMAPSEKDARSHRGKAFRQLALELRARLHGDTNGA
ncbi:MAG: non-canonical purine NTP pyrophosphatase [Gemmatimonadetes bacterium]|nr:non-canonical purine NTP pyrophosphatase [Gemmatimonadota bacterium]MDA1103246.1 non-canonical purine NTP pyrophosphatase [Gemmatimonadota bacterium]